MLLPSLTSLRFFAALFVLIHHTRHMWHHSMVTDRIGQIGWLGVSLFFVLSGFVLMWTFNSAMPAADFIARRLARIYPLHLFCLAVVMISFSIGGPVPGYHGTPLWGTILNFGLVHDWGLGHPEVRQGWNGVSWTLSCELFFYILAPAIFAVAVKRPERFFYFLAGIWAVILALSAVETVWHWTLATDVFYHPAPHLIEFALGAVGAVLVRAGWRFVHPVAALAVMFAPVLLYCAISEDPSGLLMNALFIPGAFLLIVSLARSDLEGPSWMQSRPLVMLGEASFALYMTHTIVLSVFDFKKGGDWLTLFYASLAISVAVGVHFLIEQPARIFLMKKLKQLSSGYGIVKQGVIVPGSTAAL